MTQKRDGTIFVCKIKAGETAEQVLERSGNSHLIEHLRFQNFLRRYSDPHSRVSEEIFLCRKINFGKNGNFVRYSPVQNLSKREIIALLLNIIRMKKGGNTF